jgi:hypothetical protein
MGERARRPAAIVGHEGIVLALQNPRPENQNFLAELGFSELNQNVLE